MERRIEQHRIEAMDQDDILLIMPDIKIPIFKIIIGIREGYEKLHHSKTPMNVLVYKGIIGKFFADKIYFDQLSKIAENNLYFNIIFSPTIVKIHKLQFRKLDEGKISGGCLFPGEECEFQISKMPENNASESEYNA